MTDPFMATFLREIPNIIAGMDIETRALYCQMSDAQRTAFLIRVYEETREKFRQIGWPV